jgi:cytochrome c oxidase subunit 2
VPFRGVFGQLLWVWSVIAAVVFGLVVLLLLFAVLRNRAARRANLPFKASKNTALEGGYVVLLTLVVGFLVYGSFLANAKEHDGVGLAASQVRDPVTVNVTAFQWCWDFAYQQAPVHATGSCSTGSYPTVVVPAGQPVVFNLTSHDVIHSFWLPDFAAKRWVWPDHVNKLRLVFPQQVVFRGRCAEFCGTHHTTMDFFVRVVSPAQYQQFLAGGEIPA